MTEPIFSTPLRARRIADAEVLSREFYQRPTVEVARSLLGKLLVRTSSVGTAAVRLTEVEAYLGPEDPACHTYGGRRTERVRSMWGEVGCAYVYLVYGIHHCLNVVTAGHGAGEAVLIRGGVPVHGADLIRDRRGPRVAATALSDGPGKLCQALAITRDCDGCDLCGARSPIKVCDDGMVVCDQDVFRTPRVGVGYAAEAARWPLRFEITSR
jgi:DNA-3-methyladenine glycosylase